ncbi:MAG: hypothetical protein SV375_02325 [Thermodesulfobacteriota bacterium]|nr:hypothetical protein [Thermodesulfobacteriota bacterium]
MNGPALKEKDRACTRIGASCTLFTHFREIKYPVCNSVIDQPPEFFCMGSTQAFQWWQVVYEEMMVFLGLKTIV